MNLSLPAHIQKLIEERVRSGRYSTPEDVVVAAIASLDLQESSADFESGELERLLDEGEQSGKPIDADDVFREVRALRERHQTRAG
jgi:putative addiction module CopG family antidote